MTNTPVVKDLKIDKLILNIPTTENISEIYKHAYALPEQFSDMVSTVVYMHGDRYRGRVRIDLGKPACAILHFDPLNSENSPLRLEILRSSEINLNLANLLTALTAIFGLSVEKVMELATMSEVKVSLTLDHCSLDTMFFTDDAKRRSTISYDKRGKMQVVLLGSTHSEQYLEITQPESVAKNSSKTDETGIAQNPHLKICAHIQLIKCPTATFQDLPNPFQTLRIVNIPATNDDNISTAWLGFLDSCRLRGMHAALARIEDKTLRNKFRNRLCARLTVNWWDACAVWAEFSALSSQLNLFPNKVY